MGRSLKRFGRGKSDTLKIDKNYGVLVRWMDEIIRELWMRPFEPVMNDSIRGRANVT